MMPELQQPIKQLKYRAFQVNLLGCLNYKEIYE